MEARLGSIKKDATQGHSGDFAEQAQERENDEVVDAIGNELAQLFNCLIRPLSEPEQGNMAIVRYVEKQYPSSAQSYP